MFQLVASPLLPGAIAWGMLPGKEDESDSPRSGYAGQKTQHSQPEEFAMLAILFFTKQKCWDRWKSKKPNVVAMLGKVEISSSAFENDDRFSFWRLRPLELDERFSFSCH